jgi:predicted transcriptional regulator of viral defense system
MKGLTILLQSDQKLFHTQDLALILGISNRHNLRVTISRYIKKGILKPIYRGLYSTIPFQKIDKYKLGSSFIHRFCYVSLQSIFELHGVINQVVYGVTYVSSVSKTVVFKDTQFIYKQMKQEFLLNPEGIILENGIYKASLERAVADMNYFNPKFYFDSPDLINWDRVAEIKKIVGY